MIQTIMDNLPWVFAFLLAFSEALALIPQLKSNSILQLVYNSLKKAEPIVKKVEEHNAKKSEEKTEESK